MRKICFASGLCSAAFLLAVHGPGVDAFADDWTYMDDRSSPQKLVESYYFAINNRYYAQAYGYFKPDSAPGDFEA